MFGGARETGPWQKQKNDHLQLDTSVLAGFPDPSRVDELLTFAELGWRWGHGKGFI